MEDRCPAGMAEGHPLRETATQVAAALIAAGHEAWFVGGSVRDGLLGLPLKDVDIATSATPDQVKALFRDAKLVGKRFGVCVVRRGGHQFEIATFRHDGAYLNHRHPETVTFGSREDDAARRDFTANALYQHPVTGEIVDPTGGLADLKARVLRCVGEPRRRFHEDALRLLRAIRFAARFGFTIERETWLAIRELAPTIQFISPERQRDELTAMLTGPDPAKALRLLDESGLLELVLPEISAMHGVEQGREHHPEGDVFEHTLLVVHHALPRTTVNAWAALLHDVAKPPTFARDPETGRISFYEHQSVGAEMARAIMERLKFPNEEINIVANVVARHMDFRNTPQMKLSTLRRFLGAPSIEADLAVHRADCLGSTGRLDYWEFCRAKIAEFGAQPDGALPPPLLRGNDLLKMGMKPGAAVGDVLKRAMDLQLNGELKTREEALEWGRAEAGKRAD